MNNIKNLMSKLGMRIREARTKQGLKQKDVAKKVGTDYTYIGLIERGKKHFPSLRILIKISKALNLRLSDLFEEEREKTEEEKLAEKIHKLSPEERNVVESMVKLLLLSSEERKVIEDMIEVLSKK